MKTSEILTEHFTTILKCQHLGWRRITSSSQLRLYSKTLLQKSKHRRKGKHAHQSCILRTGEEPGDSAGDTEAGDGKDNCFKQKCIVKTGQELGLSNIMLSLCNGNIPSVDRCSQRVKHAYFVFGYSSSEPRIPTFGDCFMWWFEGDIPHGLGHLNTWI